MDKSDSVLDCFLFEDVLQNIDECVSIRGSILKATEWLGMKEKGRESLSLHLLLPAEQTEPPATYDQNDEAVASRFL